MFLFSNTLFLLVASVLVFTEAALVDNFKKCSIKNEKCLQGFYQLLIETLAKDGAPELGIEKIDPIGLKEVTVQVLGLLNVTLSEGTFEGIKSCEVKSYTNDVDSRISSLHLLCDKVTILGRYELDLLGTLLQIPAIDVKKTHGNGIGKIVADKVDIYLEYPYNLEKKDDGVHFKLDTANAKHSFDILEKATFEADNIVDGDPETSKKLITQMNDNWKLILQTFGKDFFNKVIEYINFYAAKFFDNVSTQHFIIEDLTPHVKQ